MTETILHILYSKPHNKHYLNRYIKFIESRHILEDGLYELHHICPKAKDLFPEFNSKEFSWNFIKLSYREHFIAHWLLWKAYNTCSMSKAFYLMSHTKEKKLIRSSKTIKILKEAHIQNTLKSIQKMVDNGTHPSNTEEFKLNAALRMHKYNLIRIIKRKYSRYKIDIEKLLELKLLTIELNIEFRNEWIPHTSIWMSKKIEEIKNNESGI